jgi:phosphate transport system permease protein
MTAALSMRRKVTNGVMLVFSGVCTVLAVSVLFFILGYLFIKGGTSLNLDFFTKLPAPTGETGGGMANAILGSAKVLMLATCIGVPIGFIAGVYLSEYAGAAFASVVRFTTDLLNGVPSIVVGIVVYTLVVLKTGIGPLAGGIALGIMMIPIALRSTEEFLRAVPNSLREGSMALGANKWKTIVSVVVPAAIRGIVSGMMLNLARVAGETAPLLLTAGLSMYYNHDWHQPVATLPVMIYTDASSPQEDLHQQAWAAGFVLLTLVLLVNIVARTIVSRGSHKPR